MADFYSFEYVDEPANDTLELVENVRAYRKNQSLSMTATFSLRETMSRLVPSSFLHGESGIGNRAYELYGLCVGRAFTGARSTHIITSLCVMHATYERKSELVILPNDIEFKFADMNVPGMRYSKLLNQYDTMCQCLQIPRLEPSMERVFDRVLRFGCRMTDEATIFQLTQTGMQLYTEFSREFPPAPQPIPGKKTNYAIYARTATVAVTCMSLASRYHQCKASVLDMAEELHISPRQVHNLISLYQDRVNAGREKRKRSESFWVGKFEIPPPVPIRKQTNADRRAAFEMAALMPHDEVFSLIPAHTTDDPYPAKALPDQPRVAPVSKPNVPASDPLGFLYADFSDLLEPTKETRSSEEPEEPEEPETESLGEDNSSLD